MNNKTCKHCGSLLVIKQTRRTPEQLKKQYYYTAYRLCPQCHRIYHSDEFKVVNENFDLFSGNHDASGEPVDVEIWTDGACVNNGKPHASAAWAFVSGDYEKAGVVTGKQTNNRAEAEAILEALKWAGMKGDRRVRILSDSLITINNMKKPLAKILMNRDIYENMFDVIKKYNLDVVYEKVLGHSGVEQNERVDKLANGLAMKEGKLIY